jgi:hypothetical protein
MGKKRKSTEDGELQLPKKQQTSRVAKESEKRLIIVLEGAHLETCKVSYRYHFPYAVPGMHQKRNRRLEYSLQSWAFATFYPIR